MGNTMAQTAPSTTGEGQRGKGSSTCQSVWVCLVLAVFSSFIAQGNGFSVSRAKRDDPCPKLEFMSSSGCRPCSLCAPGQTHFDILVRSSCKQKHPHLQVGDQWPWCDHPHGPFPECPPIREEVLGNCTQTCKSDGRTFAPGCECLVGCPGDKKTSLVTCTRDLTWNNNSNIPSQCSPPTSPTPATTRALVLATASSAAVEGGESLETEVVSPPLHTEKALLDWHWGAIIGVVCVVILMPSSLVVVYFCCLRKKENGTSENQGSSESSSPRFSRDSEKTYKSDSPLLGKEKVEKCSVSGTVPEKGCNSEAQPESSSLESGSEVVEVEMTLQGEGKVTAPETQSLLRSAPPSSEEPQSAKEAGVMRKTPSQQALKALLNDRNSLVTMMRLFDQKNQFDRVTWHTLAMEFVGWDTDTIHNMEYMSMPQAGCSPGDSFICKVLEEAYNSGKGLQELLQHLQDRKHVRHTDAEAFLTWFWQQWKQTNTPLTQHPLC